MKKHLSAVWAALCIITLTAPFYPLQAQSPTFEQKLARVTERAEFAHSRFGIEFYSLDTGKVVYALNSQQLFVPGSTTKLVTAGTALELLGGTTVSGPASIAPDRSMATAIFRSTWFGWRAAFGI